MDQLGSALRKGGIKDPLLFFPQTRRSQEGLVTSHFREAGLTPVADYFQRRAAKEIKDGTVARLKEMRGGQLSAETRATNSEVIDFLKEEREKGVIAVDDFAPMIWEALMNSVDWSQRQDQIEQQAMKEIKVSSCVNLAHKYNILNL